MSTVEYFVDAGQSGVRIRSIGEDTVTTLTLPSVDTSRALARQLSEAIVDFAQQTRSIPWRISVSSTGLSDPEATARRIAHDVQPLGTRAVIVAHDAIAGFLSALGSDLGAVTAVGTGVVTLGVGPGGVARVDGWGNLIGDAGSGYWIGRAALDAAMRGHDGRGPRTALLDVMTEEFTRVEEAYLELQADQDRVSRIASFARRTIELAETDPAAAHIVDLACDELVLSLDTALTRVGFAANDSPALAWTGSVAKNPRVSALIARKISDLRPRARIIEPSTEPLDGVERLAHLADGHPLRAHIASISTD
jgi:glucosamine kinase